MKEYADQAFPTREAFYQSLERSGIRVEDYKKGIARQMANEQLMRTAVGEVVVSEDEAGCRFSCIPNSTYFFRNKIYYDVGYENIMIGNGSDEILA